MLKAQIWLRRCITLIEYIWNYSDTTDFLWFYSKDEATGFNASFENNNNFKSFMYKARFLVNTVAQSNTYQTNRIPQNATIVKPLII